MDLNEAWVYWAKCNRLEEKFSPVRFRDAFNGGWAAALESQKSEPKGEVCPHLCNNGGCIKTVGHKKCKCHNYKKMIEQMQEEANEH